MSLRFVILGLLVEQPLHGYAIQAAIEDRLGELCEPGYGDVYRVLATLSRDGLVAASTTRIGRRPRRKVYAPTAAGRHALHAWLGDGSDGTARAPRDEPWLRILVAAHAAPDLLPALLDVEVRRRRSALRELETLRPSAQGAGAVLALVRGLRHASALDAARAALRSAELCARVLARHRAGAPVAELLHALARRDERG